jgi:hypothetical protein
MMATEEWGEATLGRRTSGVNTYKAPGPGQATRLGVVIDQAERVRQSIQVRQEVTVIEVGPAVDDDDGQPLSDLTEIEDASPTGMRPSRGAPLRTACNPIARSGGNAVTSASARPGTTERGLISALNSLFRGRPSPRN